MSYNVFPSLSKKKKDTNELTYKTKTDPHRLRQGALLVEGTVREFGMDMYTLLYLNEQSTRTYCIACGTLFNVTRQPGYKGSWGRMDTHTHTYIYIYMVVSLRCSPETITIVNQLYSNTIKMK